PSFPTRRSSDLGKIFPFIIGLHRGAMSLSSRAWCRMTSHHPSVPPRPPLLLTHHSQYNAPPLYRDAHSLSAGLTFDLHRQHHHAVRRTPAVRERLRQIR